MVRHVPFAGRAVAAARVAFARRGAPAGAVPPVRLVPLAGFLLLGGCAAPGESPDELADRYAREETQLIDAQSFEQARERSRLQRDARRRATIASAPPLEIDPALTDRWQFGSLAHPLTGATVCAALSGVGETALAPGEPAPRLLVLADAAFVTSDVALLPDGEESAVRIDSGLPVPLDLLPDDDRVATLRIAQDRLFDVLRGAGLASIEITAAGADVAIERVIALDSLGPMLDELERCDAAGTS